MQSAAIEVKRRSAWQQGGIFQARPTSVSYPWAKSSSVPPNKSIRYDWILTEWITGSWTTVGPSAHHFRSWSTPSTCMSVCPPVIHSAGSWARTWIRCAVFLPFLVDATIGPTSLHCRLCIKFPSRVTNKRRADSCLFNTICPHLNHSSGLPFIPSWKDLSGFKGYSQPLVWWLEYNPLRIKIFFPLFLKWFLNIISFYLLLSNCMPGIWNMSRKAC